MDATFVQLGGMTVSSPVTVGTNLLLAVECWLCHRRLRAGGTDRRGLWSLFFLTMAFATLAGAFKHGLGDAVRDGWPAVVPWASNLAAAAAVWLAQQAALAWGAGARPRSVLGRLATVQLVVFLMATLEAGPSMLLLVGHTAVGLMPVMVAEARAPVRAVGGAWISGGLMVSMASGLVYLGGLSLGRWLTEVDIAHGFMAVSFWLIFKGASGPAAQPQARTSGGVTRLATLPGDG